jgi:hypothetical protein
VKAPVALLGLVSVVGGLAYTEDASAAGMIIKDRSTHQRDPRFDITGHIFPFTPLNAGIGAWVYLPIVPDGFIPSVNETFGLEFGLMGEYYNYNYDYGFQGYGYEYRYSWWALAPLGGVRWDFHLTQFISVFALAKVGFQIGFGRDYYYRNNGIDLGAPGPNPYSLSGFAYDAGVGAYFNFSKQVALRLEVGARSFFSAGVSFAL